MGSMLLFNMIFGLFIILIVFISLDKGTSEILLNDTITDLNDTNTTFSQNVKGTLEIMNTSWIWIPVFALFGVIYMVFSNTQAGG